MGQQFEVTDEDYRNLLERIAVARMRDAPKMNAEQLADAARVQLFSLRKFLSGANDTPSMARDYYAMALSMYYNLPLHGTKLNINSN